MKNIKALRQFRLAGRVVIVGEVVSKDDFKNGSGEWRNLCNMTPPKAEETDEKVGLPGKAKAVTTGAGVVPGV